jgi:hypothetical protein
MIILLKAGGNLELPTLKTTGRAQHHYMHVYMCCDRVRGSFLGVINGLALSIYSRVSLMGDGLCV